MSPARTVMVFAGLMVVAACLRFPLLSSRPMHCDEGVNADKLGVLLEQGRFEYSTTDFHGPTLYYLSLLPAWIRGITHYADLNESLLRSVPAIICVLLVGAHILLVPYFGLAAAAMAGLLLAVSPAMVYYSRYYIHEILFIFLSFCTLVAVLKYFQGRRAVWACAAGAGIGLMYATKETVILSLFCMGAAFAILNWGQRKQAPAGSGKLVSGRAIALTLGTAVLVAVILMSSFFTHPRGIVDSITAYQTYFARGSGSNTFHVHPWSYYFRLLFFYHVASGPVWSEALIGVLAGFGFWAAFGKREAPGLSRPVARFLGLYTLLMMGVYSLIPYKAPWNLLGFLHGLILMAGIGASVLIRAARKVPVRVAVVMVLAAGIAHLGWLAWESSIRYGADPRNPWVYAHTGKDVYAIIGEIDRLASAYPGRQAMPISVISRENLWPLPWYLRHYSSVQWWSGVSDTAPLSPVILITPDMEPALVHRIYEVPPPGQREMYVAMFPRYVELRPQVELRGYVANSLWSTL